MFQDQDHGFLAPARLLVADLDVPSKFRAIFRLATVAGNELPPALIFLAAIFFFLLAYRRVYLLVRVKPASLRM